MTAWHTLPLKELEVKLGTDFQNGLSKSEAARRLERQGPNELPRSKPESLGYIFLRQFRSPLIYILAAAAATVFFMGDRVDAALIGGVLAFNAILGSVQEGRARNTLRALQKFTSTTATVLHEGEEDILPDSAVIPGDIILLREGEKIPADARVIEEHNLKVDEAALTGESVPVHKVETTLREVEFPLAERRNMVFKGTAVTAGDGKAVVVATGLNTEIGQISRSIAQIDTEIPLKRNIRWLSRVIIAAVAVISAIIFTSGLWLGNSLSTMFATTVSMAVSAIPEGLPIVLTMILASGVWRMAKRNALVKKLQAVEALGQAQVIAVDKTGTLTRNEMIVRQVYIDGKTFTIGGSGYEAKGDLTLDDKLVSPPSHPELLFAGRIAAFCANAQVSYWPENQIWKVAGDPTEASFLVFGQKMGFQKTEVEREFPLISELPFDYRTKYHLTVHEIAADKGFVSIVGAPEAILEMATKVYADGGEKDLSPKAREELQAVGHNFARDGFRTVAFGYREMSLQGRLDKVEARPLTFAGYFAIEDSLRPEVPEAMARARAAGIRVVMITGDSRLTAIAIAKKAGIYREGDGVLTDAEITQLGDAALAEQLGLTTVFARITPEHKMKIIQAYRRRGEIVAMTGDGVNDAPSLVAADLGVAMGKIGTEVAKEAADIVLLDDNFGSIVSAVEEGRGMYATIQKTLLFLISTSIGEVLTIAGALFAGLPLPLLPAQILWLNLVTDSFVAFPLAFDPWDENLLRNPFHRPNKFLIDGEMLQRMIVMAVPIALGTLTLFGMFYATDPAKAYTVSLTALAVFQWLNGWNCRSRYRSVFATNPFANRYLVAGVCLAVGLQVFATYNPFMQDILHTSPLTLRDWLAITAVAFSIILIEEIRKFFYRLSRPEPAKEIMPELLPAAKVS